MIQCGQSATELWKNKLLFEVQVCAIFIAIMQCLTSKTMESTFMREHINISSLAPFKEGSYFHHFSVHQANSDFFMYKVFTVSYNTNSKYGTGRSLSEATMAWKMHPSWKPV